MECSKDDENVLSLILDMNGKKPVENLIENCISILDSYILDYIKVCQAEIQKSLNNSSNYLRSNSIAKLIEHKRKTLIDDLLNKKDLLKEALNDRIELNHELDSNLFNDLVEKRIKLFEENFLSIIEMSKKISSNNSLSQLSDNEIDERKSLEKFTDFLSDTEVCMSLKYFKLHKSKLIKKYNKSTNKKQKTNKKLIEFVQSNMDSPLKGKSSLRKHSSDSKLEQMVFLTNLNINLNEMCGKKSNRLNESDISCNGYISSDEQSEDCYIIDDSDSNETEATSSESKPVRKYLKIKIKCGMRVLALRDPVKHVWDTAQIVKIKALENNLNYNENKLKSSSASKYLIKFDESHETRTNSGSIPEYENYKANNLNEANEETSNDSSFNEINSSLESTPVEESDDEIEVIVTENGREPIKKRRPIGYKQPFKKRSTEKPSDELVELDSSSLAFLQTPNSNELPDLPYIDYDPGTKTFILPIRSRVVTLYRVFINDSNDKNLLYSEHLCSGSIGELPCLRNSNRYLVIFDNGFVSYAKPNDVFPIFDLFESPFARLDLDHSCFVQNYFQHYPNRLMVHLDLNDIVGTYLNSKWHQLKVIEVDASLVRLELDTDMFDLDSGKVQNHSVWYYRGTFNFLPLYETLQNKINESDQLDEYEKYIKERKIASNLKLISSFSSTSFPQLAPASSKNKLKERIQQGQSKLLELSSIIRNDIVKFVPHACTNACVVKWETSLERVKYVNPLLMPAMHGWQRRICQQTQTLNTASKKWVKYMAPCGRMLRSTGEVDHYLLLTNSKLTIDMFSFDCFILTDREFEANAKYVKINDITQGKESVPISCVNCIDSSQPEQFEYSNKRIALEDVPLDINTQLMEGCKCEDNCRDRSKCSCWHKTFEATTFDVKNGMNTNVGYRGRRLQEFVSTGIFECNPLCKCDHRCSNRVVQNGISLRLQLYKSPNKGWAIRCLDDIPRGQFICTYSGHLMTEEQSDIRALETGDVYFAELDFIECLSRLKAGCVLKSDDETRASADDSDSSNSPTRKDLNLTLTNNKHNRALRKKTNNLNKTYDDEVICLDSDEDEQDRTERIASLNIEKCQQAKDLEDKMAQMREEKKRNVESSIITNGFFTNENNRFFYQDYLNDPRIFIMDAKLCGNIGRFFNHSCSPNVFVQNVFVDTYDLRFPWLAFFSINSIRAGTELSWDYQYTVGSVPGKVIFCRCGSANCRKRLI